MVSQHVTEILDRHQDDIVMLDALWQWACYPTGGISRSIWESHYSNIPLTLEARYRIGTAKRGEVLQALRGLSEPLKAKEIPQTQKYVRDALLSNRGGSLRSAIEKNVTEISRDAKAVLVVMKHWMDVDDVRQESVELCWSDTSTEQLIFEATLEMILPTQRHDVLGCFRRVRTELLGAGLLNRIHRLNDHGEVEDGYCLGPTLPSVCKDNTSLPSTQEMEQYVQSLVRSGYTEVMRSLKRASGAEYAGFPGVMRLGFDERHNWIMEFVELGEHPYESDRIWTEGLTEETAGLSDDHDDESLMILNPLIRREFISILDSKLGKIRR